jgi:hypothetical protein
MFQNMFDNIPKVLDYLAKIGIPALLTRFVNVLPTVVQSLVENIPIILDAIVSKLDRIILPLIKGILKLIPELIKRVPDLIAKIIEMLPEVFGAIIAAIPSIAMAFAEAIVNLIKKLFEQLNPFSDDSFLGKVLDPFDIFHAGGMIKARRAHEGMYLKSGLRSGEVPVIGQVGEAIMNQRFVNNVGGQSTIDKWNRDGKVSNGNVVNNIVVENMMSNDTAKVIDTMIDNNFRNGSGKLYKRVKQPISGFRPQRA